VKKKGDKKLSMKQRAKNKKRAKNFYNFGRN
jgi:hypothetical protein